METEETLEQKIKRLQLSIRNLEHQVYSPKPFVPAWFMVVVTVLTTISILIFLGVIILTRQGNQITAYLDSQETIIIE